LSEHGVAAAAAVVGWTRDRAERCGHRAVFRRSTGGAGISCRA
jgi:hypothetical protein